MGRFPVLLLIYALCLPLAIFAGYLLATPDSVVSLGSILMIGCLLASPLFIRSYHAMLIFAWNSFLIVFFLPGQPSLAMFMQVLCLFIAIMNRTLNKKIEFLNVPSVTRPLIFLLIIVVVTMVIRGGFASRIFGTNAYGGRRYLILLAAIIGYFGLTARRIPAEKATSMVSFFFLGGISAAGSDIAYLLGPTFYFLFVVFSSNLASFQAYSAETLLRFSGLSIAFLSFCYYLVARFGIEGLFDLRRFWRLIALLFCISCSLLGGFRSNIIILLLLFITQFYFEGLMRTKFLPIFVVGLVVSAFVVLPFVEKLPLSIQRSLSFLPIQVDESARRDAAGTLDWRFQMWKMVIPDIPKYLLLGKGFNFDGTDYNLTQERMRRGLALAYEDTLISGNYHSGPLTLIISFGILGVIAFVWFIMTGYRVLYQNYLYGEPHLQNFNTFLLAFFAARLIFFIIFYGQFEMDMPIFTGTVGMSVSLNGGVRTREMAVQEREEYQANMPQPAYV